MPEGEPQGTEVNDLLLCTYDDTEGTGTFGTMTNDPKSSNDTLHPGSIEDLSNIVSTGASPKYWNGYVFKSVSNYLNGTCTVHVFKVQNGQEIEVGELPEVIGNSLDIKSPDSGLVLGNDLNFYRLVDTGDTVVTELVGSKPSIPCLIEASYGGYLFAKGTEFGPAKEEKAAILSEDDPTQVASIITISTGGQSSGCDVDSQTGEFVVTSQDGFKVAKLPQLDQNGKLPVDFSLTELTFGPKVKLTDDAIRVTASNGYKYFEIGDGSGLMIVTPDNQVYTIGKAELGIQGDCPNGNSCISGVLKLESGGIYVIFNDDMDIAPVSIVPTTDPAKFMAPTLPFEKITDEPSDVTQHIVDNGCTVVTGDKSMFQPAADPCAETSCDDGNPCTTDTCANENGQAVCDSTPNVGQTCDDQVKCTTNDKCDISGDCAGTPKTCEQPANQCQQSAGCDEATGNCQTENKTDGTLCNDGNISTENDQCVSGVCQGTLIVNPEPEEDVVEEADVVEQPDTAEPDEDVAKQEEITGDTNDASDAYDTANDTADTTTDTAEDTAADQSNDNATPEVTNPETTNPEQSVDAFEDALYVEGEEDSSAEEISADIYADTQEVIAEKDHPKKTPGCGCTTTGASPEGMSGTLLLGAMLVGLAANMRYKILNALAKKK